MKTLNEWMADMESKYAVPGCEDTRTALKIIRELIDLSDVSPATRFRTRKQVERIINEDNHVE